MALIVGDPDGYLPAQIANAPDKVVMIQHVQLPDLQAVADDSGDTGGFSYTSDEDEFLLVNGKLNPIITMHQNQWQRLRIIYST